MKMASSLLLILAGVVDLHRTVQLQLLQHQYLRLKLVSLWCWIVYLGKVKSLSHVRLFATPWTMATRLLRPWDFPGKSTRVGCHVLLQGIFPTQGLNPGLLHCRQMLYPLSRLVAQKQTQIILSFLRLHTSTEFWTLLLTMRATPFLPRNSCLQ